MKNLKTIFGFLLIIAAFSCNSISAPESKSCDIMMDLPACEAAPPPPPANIQTMNFSPPVSHDEAIADGEDSESEPIQTDVPVNKKKIIRDGSMSIKAKDIGASKKNMDLILKRYNAYYDLEEFQNNDRNSSYTLKLRIPIENFEKMITAIESGSDEITQKSINSTDVTEEYMDTEARLANKREYLKRYKDILSKASTIKDILAIEEYIRTLQEEIESKEGRLKYLSDQVAYSTLDINLYNEKAFVYKPQEQDKFSERIKSSLGKGWTSIVDLTLSFISIWPVTLMILAMIFILSRIVNKRKARKLS